MPNWCNNTLTLTHTEPAMIERAKTAFLDGKLLNEFIPVPKELLNTTAGRAGDDDSYEQKLLVFKEELNLKHFGYKNWYDFCVNEWGVKWDVNDGDIMTDSEHSIKFAFMSPWGPPTQAYEKLSDLGFEIEATYYEPGMGFCGYWDNSTDESYEITGDAEWVKEHIPTLIDFNENISGNMEDYAEWRKANA